MTREAIRGRVHAAPFKPFSVRLADGEEFHGPSADHASLSPNGRLVTIYTHEGNGVRIVDVALIRSIAEQTAH